MTRTHVAAVDAIAVATLFELRPSKRVCVCRCSRKCAARRPLADEFGPRCVSSCDLNELKVKVSSRVTEAGVPFAEQCSYLDANWDYSVWCDFCRAVINPNVSGRVAEISTQMGDC